MDKMISPMKETPDCYSLSPQRGEGRGEGWKCGEVFSMKEHVWRHHPSPSFPFPVEGRGRSASLPSRIG